MSTDALISRIDRLAGADLDHVELRREAADVLRRHVDFDVGVWATVDPVTVMVTHCLLDGMERDEPLEQGVFENEYARDDVLKVSELAAAAHPVGSLVAATGGDPRRSPRFVELWSPLGIDDELRVVFRDGDSAWGVLHLLREGEPFTSREAALLERLSGPFGAALRTSLLRAAVARPDALPAPPGLIGVAADGGVRAISDEARELLRSADGGEIPAAVSAVVARRAAGLPARTALATADGRWLALHATELDGRVAVVVERIRPYELAERIVRARGLTERERQVVECVARGMGTKAIAAALFISEWTVQDHLKSIFAKFGVSSRAELVASVFFDHYAPEHDVGATPSPYGWFLGR